MNDLTSDDDRLAALLGFGILDTTPERGFDDIVVLANQLCDTPVALVSLVDRDRQWFKARQGFEPCQTDLPSSVCRHALGLTDILEIRDLTADPRTAANPLVVHSPHIRFYAGAPLNTQDGHSLGTLCVIDHVARPNGLTPAQRIGLHALANQVIAQLELRRAGAELHAERQRVLAEAVRLEALIDAQHAIVASGAKLKMAFQAIVKASLLVVDAADGAVVELLNDDEFVFDTASGSLASHVGYRLPLATSLSGRSVLDGRAIMSNDVVSDKVGDDNPAHHLGIRSLIVAPISRQGAMIGTLKVSSREANSFSARDAVMTQMLAGLVASAVGSESEARSTQTLRSVEKRYRQTFESVTEFGVIVMDREGAITDWNTGAEVIFGWTAEEMRGSDASRFYTPEDRDTNRAGLEMRLSLQEGSAVDERWYIRKDGSRFYASGNVMPLWGDNDEHLGFVKIVRDRTEQHLAGKELEKAQAALSDSEQKWRGLFENLHEGFLVGRVLRDDTGRIFDWVYEEVNRAWGELVGISSVDAIGKTVREVIPGIEDSWVNEFANVVEAQESIRFTRQVESTGRWYDGICQPVGEDRFTVIFLEVTDRVLAERRREALRELSDILIDAEAPADMVAAAARIVGQTLEIKRVGYGTVADDGETFTVPIDWTAEGYPSLAGIYRMDDYGGYAEDLRRGRMVVIPDIRLDPRTAGDTVPLESVEVRSLVNLPIVERGRTVAILYINDNQPRIWTEKEIEFVREVAQRTRVGVARLEVEERQDILNAELAHRLKNNLALVQSIVSQTLRTAIDVPSARNILAERIRALGKAHDVLMTGRRDAAPVEDIVRSTVALLGEGGRVAINGPRIELGASAAMSLVLICHELATNASKYGALSVDRGRVEIRWRVEADAEGRDCFIFEWIESGGPTVTPPSRSGFGTRLIEMGLSGAAGAQTKLDYAPSGLVCRLAGSLGELQAGDEHGLKR